MSDEEKVTRLVQTTTAEPTPPSIEQRLDAIEKLLVTLLHEIRGEAGTGRLGH